MIKSKNLIVLNKAFTSEGFVLRVVGGAVRDHILGEDPKDIDLCTDATPREMLDIANIHGYKFLPTGIQHGTATFVVNGDVYEITTLRIDAATDGRHATVEFTRDFERDAMRRDLTINAMSMDFDGDVYDYFGGTEDLINRRIRFVGNADARIKEDYLRLLRFFRFCARFGGIHESFEPSMVSNANLDGLRSISIERVWMEMQKILTLPHAVDVLKYMSDYGVLSTVGLAEVVVDVQGLGAIAALSTMVTPANLDLFLETWKLSSAEANRLRYLVINTNRVVDFQDELVDGVPIDWVVDLCELQDIDVDQILNLLGWKVPTFPVTGQDLLILGVAPGKPMGDLLRSMKEQWKKSRFTLDKQELVKHV